MHARAAAASLIAVAAAQSCGPSASNFVIVPFLPGTSVATAQAACSAYNMDMLALTNSNFIEVSSLVFNCLGRLRQAMIKSWNGDDYGVPCLLAYVSTATGGMGVAAPPTCPPPQAVICQPRPGVPINFPPVATTTVTATSTVTLSPTSTIPASTETATATATTTSTSTVTTGATCEPALVGNEYVFLTDATATSANAAAKCAALGLDLAIIDDLTIINQFVPCLTPGSSWLTQPVLPNEFSDLRMQLTGLAGVVSNQIVGLHSAFPAVGQATGGAVCMDTSTNAIVYNYIAGPFDSSAAAQVGCSIQVPPQQLATYPASGALPNITGFTSTAEFLWVGAVQMPVASTCAILGTAFLQNLTVQQLFTTSGQCTELAPTGVLCKLPQL